MPLYSYVCSKCGETKEVSRSMRKADKAPLCECGQRMTRDFKTDLFNPGDKEYGKPIHSDALAIMPSQVEEHQRKHPDVPLDSECRPVFTSYKQHQKYLDETGFIKQRQRIRKKRKRIK